MDSKVVATYHANVVIRNDAPIPTPTIERLARVIEQAVTNELESTGYKEATVNATVDRTDR